MRMDSVHRLKSCSGLPWTLATLLLAGGLRGENLLPNASFEQGTVQPLGWQLVGAGRRVAAPHDGRSAIMVEGRGNQESYWRIDGIELTPGSLYRLSFYARREPAAATGAVIVGSGRINRDFVVDDSWQRYSYAFCTSLDPTNDFFRLGQWHVNGKIFFDDAQLLPAAPVHRRWPGELELGEGERIQDRIYRFKPNYNWPGANFHRPLARNRAGFNSNRWLFYPGAEVVYRFSVAGATQTNGTIRPGVGYHAAGALRVEASRDGNSWLPVVVVEGGRRTVTNALPAQLFPAREIWVRLSPDGPSANFQVNAFEYQAALVERVPDVEGETRFVDILESNPALAVKVEEVRPDAAAGALWIDFALTNRSERKLELRGVAALESVLLEIGPTHPLPAGQATRLTVKSRVTEPGRRLLRLRLIDSAGQTLFAGQSDLDLGWQDDPRPGYLLNGAPGLDIWWCESGWKIGPDRRPPPKSDNLAVLPLTVFAARGEYEAAQLILRPQRDGRLLAVNSAALKNPRGESAPISVTVNEQAFIQVEQASDAAGTTGWYPDPLPPLQPPRPLRAGWNTSLWLLFHIGRDAGAGDYHGDLSLETSFGTVHVPLRVHVYAFALPVETHLKSAVGLEASAINRYQLLTDRKQQEQVYEQYLRNFAEHRISPFSFYTYAPVDLRYEGEGTNKHVRVDFSRFDPAAQKWLDEYHFNTFKLAVSGMGSGDSQHRAMGELAGAKEGSPEHARLLREYLSQIEQHLQERGWLDKAYTYWFDEPNSADFHFVAEGMKRLKAAGPGIRRMLTTVPKPSLLGTVDIWCGLLHQWTPASIRERQAAGEEVWWYICTVPKAPYATEFIDHPATEMRVWPWQSWQHGVTGILLWNTVFWNSATAFPAPQMQDPWTDPMSYISGSAFAAGLKGAWGNGDGRFLYPPCHPLDAVRDPCLAAPVNSLRWENLRDGMEDYEYFWLLQQAIGRSAGSGGDSTLLGEARQLLVVPPEVSRDLTHFTTDPRPLLTHRDRLAQMIEKLQSADNPSR
jgi:hypothetical protein